MRTIPVRSSEILAAKNLLAEYAAECSIPLIGQINPQPEIYEALEAKGVLKCFGAFEGEELVGFATVLTTVLPHYGKKVATVESVFAPRYGAELIQAVKQYAKEAGCGSILYSTPAGGRMERLLSLKKKTVKTNTIFCERL